MITIEGFLLGCFLVTAVYHTYLFLFYKGNYAALYFALITYASTVLTLIKETDWMIRYKVILVIFIIVPVFYLEFTRHMYPAEFKGRFVEGISRLVHIYAALFSALVLVLPMETFLKWSTLFQKVNFPVNMLLIVYLFIQMFRAARSKRSDARILLVGFLVLFLTAIAVYMVPGSMMKENNPIGALGILFLYSGTLARRYSKAYHTCESIVEERTEELKEKNDALERLVSRDALTGAFSRRHIIEALEALFNRNSIENKSLSMIAFDLDHFKTVNDTYGHPMGDRVLVEISKKINVLIASRGYKLGRIGGEEFIVLLPDTSLNDAVEVAEQIRGAVKSIEFKSGENPFSITCSLGVVTQNAQMENYDTMMIHADQLLYKAKDSGRDRVCV